MKNKRLDFFWRKRGRILESLPDRIWSKSHLQFPSAIVGENIIKVFVTTRPDPEIDKKYVTYISSFDLEISEEFRIDNFSEKPILELGSNGSFDQFGTMPGDFVEFDNKIFMFYTGWNRLDRVPYNFSVGLAISNDKGKSFNKYSDGPVIGQTTNSPYTCGSGAVLFEDGYFHMFCISGKKWIKIDGKLEHTYTIKHAISNDGVKWNFLKDDAIKQVNELEAIAAPTVIKINDIYHMWFSYRDSIDFRGGPGSYRIGYAFSENLFDWTRDDKNSGIQVSDNGWDSEMVCYPYVFNFKSKYYMIYNGNDFGRTSLGIAELSIK